MASLCHDVLKNENFFYDIIEEKMMGKATLDRKRMELMDNTMEGIDCGQLKGFSLRQIKMEMG